MFGGINDLTNKHVLIMDEVDGMSGNEDRGGVQELIACKVLFSCFIKMPSILQSIVSFQ